MKWSFKLGRVAGIDIMLHATFALIILFVIASHWLAGNDLRMTFFGVLFTLAIFICVLLHELGHALAARSFGIRTKDITLLPIGGVARLERMPDRPMQELWVALAGPAVNVAIAMLLFMLLIATNSFTPLSDLSITGGNFWERLLVVNVVLVLFNLLPAFPMDGGRVLRALLATRLEYTRATQIAANTGQAMALAFGLIGLFSNPLLIFVALFVWIGASQENSLTQMKSSLAGIPVSRAMVTKFDTLAPTDPLSHAVDSILKGSQVDFPVLHDGKVSGVLTKTDLIVALTKHPENKSVADVMQRDIHIVDVNDMLESALQKLQTHRCHTIPVTHDGTLVGLVTMENLGEFLMIQSALKSSNKFSTNSSQSLASVQQVQVQAS